MRTIFVPKSRKMPRLQKLYFFNVGLSVLTIVLLADRFLRSSTTISSIECFQYKIDEIHSNLSSELVNPAKMYEENQVTKKESKKTDNTSTISSINKEEAILTTTFSNDSRDNRKENNHKAFPARTNSSTPLSQSFLANNETLNLTQVSPLCPLVPPHLSGPVKIRLEAPPMKELEKTFEARLQLGGRYSPPDCHSRHRVAIIVPYRNREQQLPLFMQHMHDFLPRQQLDYTIYVVEQAGNASFNRAVLMNIGIVEALKQHNFQCFVFHDIDLLPEDDRNIYSCPEQPRHMAVAVSTYRYKLAYKKCFGGVSAMLRSHVEKVNGWSNLFWGWGGEDDDMYNRVIYYNLTISRYPTDIARYTMLSHKKAEPNPKRYDVLRNGAKRAQSDGLSSLRYKLLTMELKRLYTWILVEINTS